MTKIMTKLRYFPGDSLDEIRKIDLEKIGKQFGMVISYEKIEKREMKDGLLMENTIHSKIEEITQEVVTVEGDQEKKFSDCIRALYKKYRCPRTSYSLMGSNEAGQKIAWGLMEEPGIGGWE
jgi:hypothetical protein